jgi:hypothetical protein
MYPYIASLEEAQHAAADTIRKRRDLENEVSRNRPNRFYPDKLADGLEPVEPDTNITPIEDIIKQVVALNLSIKGVKDQMDNNLEA